MRIRALCVALACWSAGVQAQEGDCSISLLAGSVYGQSQHADADGTNLTPAFNIDGNGGGVGFGCRWRNGRWVGGFEADYMKTSTKGSTADQVGHQSETEVESTGTLRLIAGFLVRTKLLFYLTGGLATGSVKASVCPTPGACSSESHRLYGGVFGGGFDYAFTQQVSARLEALWVGFDNKAYFQPAPVGSGIRERSGGVSPDVQTIRVGLSWHF